MNQPEVALPLDEAQRLFRLLWRLEHAIESCSKQMARRIGITFQQRTVLRFVGRFPGITAGKLAETLHIDPGTLSSTLARLEARRLLQRRPDPKDRRRILLGLTRKGRALDVPEAGTVESAVKAALARLRVEQVSTAENVLVGLIDQLEDTATRVPPSARASSSGKRPAR